MKQLGFKWLSWTAPLNINGGATSDKRGDLDSDDSSGTSGTPGRELYHVLSLATLNPAKVPTPESEAGIKFEEIKKPILAGKVILMWSKVVRAWVYVVHNSSQIPKIHSKYPEAVVYTLKELELITGGKPPAEVFTSIHILKAILGAELVSIMNTAAKERIK